MQNEDRPSIANESEAQYVAAIVIQYDTRTSQLNVAYPGNSELVCRFMMDKARAFLDDEWRKRNAPLVTPPNGALKRIQFHGGPRGV